MARIASQLLLLHGLLMTNATQAHLMPAQQGTVNIVGNVLFTAISVPVSALTGISTTLRLKNSTSIVATLIGSIWLLQRLESWI